MARMMFIQWNVSLALEEEQEAEEGGVQIGPPSAGKWDALEDSEKQRWGQLAGMAIAQVTHSISEMLEAGVQKYTVLQDGKEVELELLDLNSEPPKQ